jgi:hypothetical protein
MLDVSTSVDPRPPNMRQLSVAEQRYQAVLAVISDGIISQVEGREATSPTPAERSPKLETAPDVLAAKDP